MRYFQNMEISHTNLMGRKDLKTLNKNIPNFELNLKKEYKLSKYKNKYSIVTDAYPIFFCIGHTYFPTLKLLNNEDIKYKVVVLDDGAYKPILRGADIMAGGVYKNMDFCDDFKKDEVVGIKIRDEFIGVGLALIDKVEINEGSSGKVIDVYHYKGDELDDFSL